MSQLINSQTQIDTSQKSQKHTQRNKQRKNNKKNKIKVNREDQNEQQQPRYIQMYQNLQQNYHIKQLINDIQYNLQNRLKCKVSVQIRDNSKYIKRESKQEESKQNPQFNVLIPIQYYKTIIVNRQIPYFNFIFTTAYLKDTNFFRSSKKSLNIQFRLFSYISIPIEFKPHILAHFTHIQNLSNKFGIILNINGQNNNQYNKNHSNIKKIQFEQRITYLYSSYKQAYFSLLNWLVITKNLCLDIYEIIYRNIQTYKQREKKSKDGQLFNNNHTNINPYCINSHYKHAISQYYLAANPILKIDANLQIFQKTVFPLKEYLDNCQTKNNVFMKNPSEILNSHNQIFGTVQFHKTYQSQRNPLKNFHKLKNKKIKSSLCGGHSNIQLIEKPGIIFNTYQDLRSGNLSQKDYPKQKITQNIRILRLICKSINQKPISRTSLFNQFQFLKLVGSSICPYICNFYRQTSNINCLYSQYHQYNMMTVFFVRHMNQNSNQPRRNGHATLLTNQTLVYYKIKLSDFLNFAQQILFALKIFYIEKGFLHRDIKALNILISKEGIIKIIDHGSIFCFKSPGSQDYKKFQRIYHKQIQLCYSLIRVDNIFMCQLVCTTSVLCQSQFLSSPYLRKQYKTYQNYRIQNDQHQSFDVYSVGILFSYMLQNHIKQNFVFSLYQVRSVLKNLIDQMIQGDFKKRLTVEQALNMVRDIRKMWFGGKR